MSGAYSRVRQARDNGRPTGLDYIKNIFDGFIELHGDRRYADDPAIVGGIATLNGNPVTVIAIEKGHTAKERTYRNFGAPHPEGYRKALRLMKQAEKFGRPIRRALTAGLVRRNADRGRQLPKICWKCQRFAFRLCLF